MKGACLFGTHIDYGRSYQSEACIFPKAPGADYCAAHLKRASCCVVRYCPEELHTGDGYEKLCEPHRAEYHRQTKPLLLWLATRSNPHAARVESLRGSISLESIGIVVVFVVLALFFLSFFVMVAGGLFDAPAAAVLGALALVGCLAFFAFLIAFDGKAKGGQCDGCLDGFDSDLLTPVDGGLFCNQCEEQARQDALLYKGAP